MPYYERENRALYYVLEGSGPPIVFLHGYLGTSKTHWGAQLSDPLLQSEFTIIAPDFRGFGKSGKSKWGESHRTEDLLEDVRTLIIDHLKLKINPILVGYSVGAALGLEYAIRYPEEVKGLVLLSPRPFIRKKGRSHPFLSKEKRSTSKSRAMVWNLVKAAQKRMSKRSIQKKIKNHELLERFSILKNIPALMVYGSEDTVTPPISFRVLKENIPQIEIKEFVGDHGIAHEKPEEFNKVLLEFCRKLNK